MGHRMALLIVDDSERMRRIIKKLIKGVAAEIYECSDGAQALASYAAHSPDWVLMDIEMGGLDGITATRQIKAVFPDANIIIVTNYDDESLRAAAEQAGACNYLVKENLVDLPRLLQRRQA